MGRSASSMLLLSLALPGLAADPTSSRDPAFDFVAGRYAIVGRQPDNGASYSGTAVIAVSESGFTLERTIGGRKSVATGAVETRAPTTMTLTRIAALVGVALLVMAANIAASILYMVVYGDVIDPGHEAR